MEALVAMAVVAGVAVLVASLMWNEKAKIRRALRSAPRVDIARAGRGAAPGAWSSRAVRRARGRRWRRP
ncbi:MAG: hypothetical protein HS111_03125 [Kofleriaceae bacterium]|nr:hypothetical protein [Kofleriaceae bacterium]